MLHAVLHVMLRICTTDILSFESELNDTIS